VEIHNISQKNKELFFFGLAGSEGPQGEDEQDGLVEEKDVRNFIAANFALD
jgi:hypothetical protein